MQLPVEGIGIGFLGRLVPEKGPLLLLEALQASGLLQAGTGSPWAVVAGQGPLEDEVAGAASSMGVAFLSPLDYRTEVPEFFRAIDIFVVPSWRTDNWEDQSLRTIIEAQLSDCVIVGSDSGAIPSMIGNDGVIVDEKDFDALAAGIRRAIDLIDTGIGVRARASAIERYSVSSDAERLVAFWRACLGGRVSPER